jgi:hypothetical protein
MARSKTYQANGRIDNVEGRILDHGDTIVLDEAQEAEHSHLIAGGALSLTESAPVNVGDMSKAELREYAQEEFGATLAADLNKQQLLDQIAALVAERIGSIAVGDDKKLGREQDQPQLSPDGDADTGDVHHGGSKE